MTLPEYIQKIYRDYINNKKIELGPNIASMAQKSYCKTKGLPHFAPTNGICWNCRNNIFKKISFYQAATTLITGCPHCHRSYCD